MEVSILILTRNTQQMTLACLRTLEESIASDRHEVIVVDNGSTDGTAEAIAARYPRVKVLRQETNLGFARGNNCAAREARGEFLFLVNSDTLTSTAVVDALAAALRGNPKLGVVGPALVFGDGRPQDTACYHVTPATELIRGARRRARARVAEAVARGEEVGKFAFISGAALMVRREIFASLGGFDERFFFYFEDNDLCKRIADQGWELRVVPEVTMTHLGGGSSLNVMSMLELTRARCQYLLKHHGPLGGVAGAVWVFLTKLRRTFLSGLFTLATLGCYARVRRKTFVNARHCLWFLLLMPARGSRLYRAFFGNWQG